MRVLFKKLESKTVTTLAQESKKVVNHTTHCIIIIATKYEKPYYYLFIAYIHIQWNNFNQASAALQQWNNNVL
jgi:hypothetical protein